MPCIICHLSQKNKKLKNYGASRKVSLHTVVEYVFVFPWKCICIFLTMYFLFLEYIFLFPWICICISWICICISLKMYLYFLECVFVVPGICIFKSLNMYLYFLNMYLYFLEYVFDYPSSLSLTVWWAEKQGLETGIRATLRIAPLAYLILHKLSSHSIKLTSCSPF